MPLIRMYLARDILSPGEKQALSAKLTRMYSSVGLPSFYVNVLFLETSPDCTYVGGEPQERFVRICIEHIALHFPSDEHKRAYMEGLDKILLRFLDGKRCRWEYHISETPRDLWKIQSIVPPPHQSVEEKTWVTENQAIDYRSSL